MKKLYETKDVWLASVIVYLYGDCLARIVDDKRCGQTTYHLAVPVLDAEIIADELRTDADSLTIKPKGFVKAFTFITKTQNDMRRCRENEWLSQDFIAGKVG